MGIKSPLIAALLTALAGGLQAVALADPWRGQAHGWLQIASLALLVTCIAAPTAQPGRRGFLLGWLFGICWLAGTFWWLFISMHIYGGLNAVLAVLAVLALAALLALYYALAAAMFAMLLHRWRQHIVFAALAFAATWTLAELARGAWFTGFPWGAGGYAHIDGLLAGYAPWVGVDGIGFIAAWLAAAVALWLLPTTGHPMRRTAVAPVVAVVLLAAGGLTPRSVSFTQPHGAPMDVALLQGNIAQDEKFVPGTGVADALTWYGQQWQSNRATLVVAPETALPLLPNELPEGYEQTLTERYTHDDQAALLGTPLGSFERGYANAVIGLAPNQNQPYRYDKHHLVPFGEFIPPLFRWFVDLMNIPLGDFTPGAIGQTSFAWHDQRLAPNICYEDLFSAEIAAPFASPAGAPTALVNLSNIGWFGDGVAIDQHLAISRMRALEFERPMLRATNTGATAIIDHRGHVVQQLPAATRDVLHGSYQGRSGLTPYARWVSRFGLLPLGLLCAALVAWAAWWRPRKISRLR